MLIRATTLGDLLDGNLEHPDRAALVFPDARMTYGELSAISDRYAQSLRGLEVQRGDKVAILMPNRIEFIAALFGAAKLGAIAVPINGRFKTHELSHVVAHSDARVLITSSGADGATDYPALLGEVFGDIGGQDPGELHLELAPHLRQLVCLDDANLATGGSLARSEFDESAGRVSLEQVKTEQERVRIRDVALLMYTSGTTSRPKGCLLTHEALVRHGWNVAVHRFFLGPDDAFWDPLPLFHIGGIVPMLGCFSVGAKYCHAGHFDPEIALRTLESERVTVAYPAFETIWLQVLNHPRYGEADLSALRLIQNIAVPERLVKMQEAMPRVAEVSSFGATECSSNLTLTLPDDPYEARMNTLGHPVPGMEAKIVDHETGDPCDANVVGELCFRGYALFEGYYKDPELTAASIDPEGWFHSGDLAKFDDDGRLIYAGRLKDMMKVGGENVSALEVEDYLVRHPAIEIVQVVGAPDALYGEVPAAFVQLRPGHTLVAAELIEFCVGRIATFKVPRYLRVVDEWPMSGTKIQKFRLRERLAEELARAGIAEAPRIEKLAIWERCEMTSWDQETDVVVMGSGAAGLGAALTANANGLDVGVFEKQLLVGGSSMLAGGGMWIPCNRFMLADGDRDTPEAALEYMNGLIGDEPPASTAARKQAFVDGAPKMIAFLESLGLRFRRTPGYPDYFPAYPGASTAGRGIESVIFDTRLLGEWAAKLPPRRFPRSLPMGTLDVALIVLAKRSPRGFARLARIYAHHYLSRLRRQQLVGGGGALVAQLLHQALRRRIPVSLEARVTELVVEDGRAAGVVVERDGRSMRVGARRAVFLGAGGFARNDAMRQRYQRHPISAVWTSAAMGDTGDGINLGAGAGAATTLMDEAWWGPSSFLEPDGPAIFHVSERTKPGSLIVDQSGRRYFNEATDYVLAGQTMFERDAQVPAIPSYLIFDQRYRDRYPFAANLPGRTPQELIDSGYFKRAGTVVGLAELCGLPADSLTDTVGRFNGFAERGIDEEFHRGENAYDRYYGDPRVKPNPCLGPLATPPFYAVALYPGDLGTKGGLVTDERGRVLRDDGSAIPSLYASGNTTASVMGRRYPGPGVTLAPALTFAWLAMLDVAGAPTPKALEAARPA